MRIKRLNENNILNKNEIKFKDAIKEYNVFGDLLRDYIKFLEPDLDIRDVYYYYYETNVSEMGDTWIFACYTNSKRLTHDDYVFSFGDSYGGKELENFYEFMEDPDLYISKEKFNL